MIQNLTETEREIISGYEILEELDYHNPDVWLNNPGYFNIYRHKLDSSILTSSTKDIHPLLRENIYDAIRFISEIHSPGSVREPISLDTIMGLYDTVRNYLGHGARIYSYLTNILKGEDSLASPGSERKYPSSILEEALYSGGSLMNTISNMNINGKFLSALSYAVSTNDTESLQKTKNIEEKLSIVRRMVERGLEFRTAIAEVGLSLIDRLISNPSFSLLNLEEQLGNGKKQDYKIRIKICEDCWRYTRKNLQLIEDKPLEQHPELDKMEEEYLLLNQSLNEIQEILEDITKRIQSL